MSNCPHCNRTTFEIDEIEIAGTKFRLVQCSGCKAPVGILENHNVDHLIHELEQRITDVLRILVTSLQKMNSRLEQIEKIDGA
jgi:hypothetical protein